MNSSVLTLPTGSNITLLPVHHATAKQKTEIQLKTGGLLALSIINIIIWAVSTVMGATVLVAFNAGLFNFDSRYSMDYGGWGIWCSWFYVIAGFTGYSASYNKRKSLLITTLVFAIFSLITSLTAATFSGIMGGDTTRYDFCRTYISGNNYIYWDRECEVWSGLEFTLMAFSIIAFFINLAVTVITSMALCSCCGKKKSSAGNAVMVQVQPGALAFNNSQLVTVPMYAAPVSPTGVQPVFTNTAPYIGRQQQPQLQVLQAAAPQQPALYPVQQLQQLDLGPTSGAQMTPLSVETGDNYLCN